MVEYWKTIGTFDDSGTTLALQQKYEGELGDVIPQDNHRVRPVGSLVK